MQPPPSISDEGKISWTLLTLSGFRMLLEPLPVLLKSTGARVGPLTSQRLVSAWLPKLRSAHSASAPSSLAWHASLQVIAICARPRLWFVRNRSDTFGLGDVAVLCEQQAGKAWCSR
eukprot:3559023-Pleurochrysis_carterae.AAC.2